MNKDEAKRALRELTKKYNLPERYTPGIHRFSDGWGFEISIRERYMGIGDIQPYIEIYRTRDLDAMDKMMYLISRGH